MTFAQLSDFIQNRMRMSHIHHPVMLMTLIAESSLGAFGETITGKTRCGLAGASQ
jgi:hypothetical protein